MKRNGVETVKLQVSVDEVTARILSRMISAGLAGKNAGEVGSWIIREWIWHNPEALARIGISIRETIPKSSKAKSN
jgi:hypothetical protein